MTCILRRAIFLLLCCCLPPLLVPGQLHSEEKPTPGAIEIPVFTYHTHPPFITETNEGLSYDLATYLNRKAEGHYRFVVMPMSRPAVNRAIEESRTGIIPWVNPAWFRQVDQGKIAWSSADLMRDGNAILSHIDRKLEYAGPQSLAGLVFGGIRGHHYAGIDAYITSSGQLRRVDADNHLDNFRKLARKRIDVTLTPASGARYILREQELQDTIYISSKLHSSYARKVIVLNQQPELLVFVDRILSGLATDSAWRAVLRNYE